MKALLVAALVAVAGPAFADNGETDEPATIEPEPLTSTPSQSDEMPPEEAPPPVSPAMDETPPPAKAQAPKARISTARARGRDDGGPLDKDEDEVAGGKHWRIVTAAGAVHVWVPEGYDRATAGTVIYVHGYYTDADGAWREHHLARQFRKSHQNAMFIVPDAPMGNDDDVKWPALKDLRHAVARANIHLPDGPVIVMGHSGAFRTVMQWVDHRLVEQIILLDAMYAGESKFDEYIAEGKRADEHKLIVVGASTASASEDFVHKYKFAVAREKVPESRSDFTKRQRNAKLLYIHAQYEHMAIVTSGKVIPLLLRLTKLKAL
jgi:hypothetical protein